LIANQTLRSFVCIFDEKVKSPSFLKFSHLFLVSFNLLNLPLQSNELIQINFKIANSRLSCLELDKINRYAEIKIHEVKKLCQLEL